MTRLLHTVVLAATTCNVAVAANREAVELRVTIYNHAQVPLGVVEEALADLRRIFRHAGVESVIVIGDPNDPESVQIAYPERPRRGFERNAACLARRDIALRITVALPSQRSTVLGMAMPLARKGLNAVVYDDRIRSVAVRRVRAHAAVLAHAMAHEIGHVLMRSGDHERIGIMSDAWTDEEYAWLAGKTLLFSRKQSDLMRRTLAGLGCEVEGSSVAALGR